MVLNEEQWIKELREKRITYGISQGRLAVASGITREYLNKIESGKMKLVTGKLKEVAYQKIDEQTEALVSMIGDNQVDYRFFLGFKLIRADGRWKSVKCSDMRRVRFS